MRLLRLLRDYAVLSAGEIAAKVAGFLAFAYLARVLGLEAYGAVEAAVALAMIFGLVVDFGLGQVGAREVARDQARAPGLAVRITALRLLLAVLAVASMCVLVRSMDVPDTNRRVAYLFALSLFAAPLTLNWLLQGLDRMRAVAAASALRMVTFLVGVAVLVRGPEDLVKIGGVEIAAMSAMGLYFVVVSWRHVGSLREAFDLGSLRRLAREALPVAVSQLLWALNHYLPTLLVASLLASDELSLFGGAHRIVISLNSFVWLYFFNLYPSLARGTDGGGEDFAELTRSSYRLTSIVGLLGGVGGTLLASPICRIAFGEAFASAALPFAVLVWILPVQLLSGHARYSLIASGHQGWELLAQAVGVMTTVSAGIVLIGRWGALGASVAMVVSALVVWMVAHVCARKQGLPV